MGLIIKSSTRLASALSLILGLTPALGAVDLDLKTAVQEALTQGPAALQRQWTEDTARLQYELALAKSGLALTPALSYGLSQTQGSAAQAGKTGPLVSPVVAGSPARLAEGALPMQAGASLTLKPLPMATLTAGATQTFMTGTDLLKSNQLGLSVQYSQTLWDGYPGGLAQASLDSARLSFEGSLVTAKLGRLSQVLTVQQAWFALLSAQENLQLTQSTLDQRRLQFQVVKTRFDNAQANQVDLQQAEVNFKTAELNLRLAQTARRTASQRLAVWLGRSPEQELTAFGSEIPALPAADLPAALQLAQEHRPEAKQYQLNLAAAELARRQADAAGGPTASFSAGVSGALDLSASGLPSAWTFSLSGKLGLPTIDGGTVSRQQALAGLQTKIALSQRDQWSANLTAALTDSWTQAAVKQEQWQVAQLNSAVLEKQRDIAKINADNGTGPLSSLLTAEVNLTNGRLAELAARSAAIQALVQLRCDLGLEDTP